MQYAKASQPATRLPWYQTRGAIAGLGILLVAGAYLIALRATDTGSLVEYFFMGLFAFVGLKLFFKGAKHRR